MDGFGRRQTRRTQGRRQQPGQVPTGAPGPKPPHAADAGPEHGLLYLAAAGVWVAPAHAVDRPLVGQVLGEDLCWRFAVADLQARRPAWWQREERSAWDAEAAQLEDKRARIEAEAVGLGLARPRPADRSRRRSGSS